MVPPPSERKALRGISQEGTLRIHRIVELLIANKYPNRRQLAEKFEVSEATISTHITHIRDRMNLPVEFDFTRNGYYLKEPVGQMPWIHLTTGDLLALTIARSEVETYRAYSMFKEMRAAWDKLALQLDGELSLRWDAFLDVLEIRQSAVPVPFSLKLLEAISGSCISRHEIVFDYRDGTGKTSKDRRLQPVKIQRLDGIYYLKAFDPEKKGLRRFMFARMERVRRTKRKFARTPAMEVDDLQNCIGAFAGENPVDVRVQVTGTAVEFIHSRIWHPTQRMEEQSAGVWICHFHVAITPYLESLVLSWGRNAKVLEPQELRDKIRNHARAMLEE